MRINRGYIPGAVFTALVAIIAFIVGLVIASNITIFKGKNTQETLAEEKLIQPTGTFTATGASLKSPFTPIAKKVLPAVVNISAERIIKVKSPFFDFPFQEFFGDIPKEFERKAKSLGSGIIFSQDGYVLTNNHVVEGADKIIITLADNTTFKGKNVEVIGTDPRTDVAVLKIHSKKNLPFAKLGDSDKIQIGDWAIAFGSPFGFSQTMTVGVISAKGRSNIPLSHGPTYQDFIQTDAAINSGNSGGPLVNINGEVIGINSAIASPSGGNVGIGFAVPINLAKSIAEQLIKKGKIVRGWLGISIQELTPEIAKGFGLKNTKGVVVSKVLSDSPAEKAGIKDGDVITRFNGEVVENLEKFRFKVAETPPRTKVKIEVIRNGRTKEITVKIGEMPEEETIAGELKPKNKVWLGLTVDNISAQSTESGVVVRKVEFNSPAEDAGIEQGDIIKRIGNVYIHNLKDYYKAQKAYANYQTVIFQIKKRNGYIVFVAVEQH